MNTKKIMTASAFTVLSGLVIALGGMLGVVCHKVGEFDKKHGSNIWANLSAAEMLVKTNSIPEEAAAKSDEDATPSEDGETIQSPPEMKILDVQYEGEDVIGIFLSERPDMDVVRNYISVEPLAEGHLSFRYSSVSCRIFVTGEFAYRTNVTLRVKKGFPLYGKGANPAPEGSLKDDFVYTFRRKDRTPYMKFADKGRYLPPAGLRAIAFESMNVTNITTQIRRVEPRNVVQMLAREESVYSNYSVPYWGAVKGEDVQELAGEVESNRFVCANLPNMKERTFLPVAMKDGKPDNGIYFITALMADHPRCDSVGYWSDEEKVRNPLNCRVVCVSDLGLSVRRWNGGGLGVWVTSLTTGKPVAGTEVTVYSSAQIKVMEGVTDENGWCEPKRVDKGEPFAIVAVADEELDMTFMALRDSMRVDETMEDGARYDHLGEGESAAFLWTERGIYRHGENIFLHAIFRDAANKAPRAFPVEFRLSSPLDEVRAIEKVMTDSNGTARCEKFSVPADQPSGVWVIRAFIPGTQKCLGFREVKIEEFAPPQIRVKVEDDKALNFPSFGFEVSAEHLFGGPAHNLRCEGAVVFEDVPFAPADWKGWRFGNEMLGLKPSFRRLKVDGLALDKEGKAVFSAPLWADSGLPKAAVRATAQGTVFEDGGRPATMRKSVIRHFYPYYIGSTMPSWMTLDGGRPKIKIVCVTTDGKRLTEEKELMVKIERIDSFYSYKTDERGWATWNCERVRSTIADGIKIKTACDKESEFELPLDKCGDYAVTVSDEKTHVSFGREFYLSDWGDNVVRAPLADPTKVSLTVDKAFYRVGEKPRLIVKSPFAGKALLSVMRDSRVYTEVLTLTNATSEVVLRPVRAENAPNLDVFISVVQGVEASAKRLAVRAHGQTTLIVRPIENEISVSVKGKVDIGESGSAVAVDVAAPGASEAVVTLVDEGINILTGEETPDPVGYFSWPRNAEHPLYDIYHRVLPVLGMDPLKKNGVKTGGGFGAEMLSRVSPIPTRRFKPLAMWKAKVPVVEGKAKVEFKLPEFVGEVRVTAVAYSEKATGSKSEQFKVSPKLVMMPDAPRFAAPGDRFDVTLPVYNRGGANGRFSFDVAVDGVSIVSAKDVALAKDASTNIVCRVVAPDKPGEMKIGYATRGFGENHVSELILPVRPAVAWKETAGVKILASGEKFKPEEGRFAYREFDSPLGDLSRAIEWLSEYPHGCLEQTVSRIFPLISAGGVLAGVKSNAGDSADDVALAGVKRVESMIREGNFVMWPDVDYAPWDEDVSLYASHFLLAAKKAGLKIASRSENQVLKFLSKWAMSTNSAVSAYAVHSLALAGRPEKDRMFRLYDERMTLSLLSRARLACAFVEIGDRERARKLLANAASPSEVKEAAFLLLALLELDSADKRIPLLVKYLHDKRDRCRNHWGTTSENSHALMAIAEYYRYNPPKKGERFVAWRKLELPKVGEVKAETNGMSVVRRFVSPEGEAVDVTALKRGEMVYAEIEITSVETRELSDLVVEDLFAGALEPVFGEKTPCPDWVMRSDVRDDRMLVFSKRFTAKAGERFVFRHPLRVVSSGEFVLPGVSVESMYFPSLNAHSMSEKITVR